MKSYKIRKKNVKYEGALKIYVTGKEHVFAGCLLGNEEPNIKGRYLSAMRHKTLKRQVTCLVHAHFPPEISKLYWIVGVEPITATEDNMRRKRVPAGAMETL